MKIGLCVAAFNWVLMLENIMKKSLSGEIVPSREYNYFVSPIKNKLFFFTFKPVCGKFSWIS